MTNDTFGLVGVVVWCTGMLLICLGNWPAIILGVVFAIAGLFTIWTAGWLAEGP